MEKKNKSEPKLEEANFEVTSLSEVKDENGNGIFHMRTKTKIIVAISTVILLLTIALMYLTIEKYLDAEMWQVIIWGLCGILALYSMFARSVLAMLLNLVLFAGVSFLPIWQSGYKTVQPVIERITEKTEENVQEELPPAVENNSVTEENKSATVEEVKPSAEVEENKSAVTAEKKSEENLEKKDSEPALDKVQKDEVAPSNLPSI